LFDAFLILTFEIYVFSSYTVYMKEVFCWRTDPDLEPVGVGGEVKQPTVIDEEEATLTDDDDGDDDKAYWEP